MVPLRRSARRECHHHDPAVELFAASSRTKLAVCNPNDSLEIRSFVKWKPGV